VGGSEVAGAELGAAGAVVVTVTVAVGALDGLLEEEQPAAAATQANATTANAPRRARVMIPPRECRFNAETTFAGTGLSPQDHASVTAAGSKVRSGK
jgi:hypothetical protein